MYNQTFSADKIKSWIDAKKGNTKLKN